MSNAHLRFAVPTDAFAIDTLLRHAFPTDLEARLVALLIERGKAAISLVAEIDGQTVGHILFSPANVGIVGPALPEVQIRPALAKHEAETQCSTGLGLAPVAVLPQFQNQGIGSSLVRKGLEECRRLGAPWVVVLGHETYYPRFGFAPARSWNLTGEYGDTDAFQFLPLTAAADSFRGGHIRYAPEFGQLFGS